MNQDEMMFEIYKRLDGHGVQSAQAWATMAIAVAISKLADAIFGSKFTGPQTR